MTTATLMNAADPAFNFEHDIAHRNMVAKETYAGSPIFFGLPYWLDPPIGDTAVPAGWGNTLHTAAHADFISLFPGSYGASGVATLNGLSLYPEPDQWWQFNNFQLHLAADQTL